MKRWLPRTEVGRANLYTALGVLVLAVAAFVYSQHLYTRELGAGSSMLHSGVSIEHQASRDQDRKVDECTHGAAEWQAERMKTRRLSEGEMGRD